MTTTDKGQMKDVHICTSSTAYDQLTKHDDELYFVPDTSVTQAELTAGLATKQDAGNYATQTDLQQGLATRQPLGDYQSRLTAGDNITIENNVISATGGGGSVDNLRLSRWIDSSVQNESHEKISLLNNTLELSQAISSRLYKQTGSNEDGSMTQKAITESLAGKLNGSMTYWYTKQEMSMTASYFVQTWFKSGIKRMFSGILAFSDTDSQSSAIDIRGTFTLVANSQGNIKNWIGSGVLNYYNGTTWSATQIRQFEIDSVYSTGVTIRYYPLTMGSQSSTVSVSWNSESTRPDAVEVNGMYFNYD